MAIKSQDNLVDEKYEPLIKGSMERMSRFIAGVNSVAIKN